MAVSTRVAESLESDLRAEAARLFGIEADAVLDMLDKLSRSPRADDDRTVREAFRRILGAYAPDGGRFHALWLERYGELIGRAVEVGGRSLAAEVGFRFDLRNANVLRAVDDRAETLATLVTRGTAERIGAAVKAGYQEGIGVRQIAAKIKASAFDGEITTARATTIARTETIGGLAHGEHLSATESGVFVEKEWLAKLDDRTRDSHAQLDGVRIGIRQRFANGLLFPGDVSGGEAADRINCRCTCLYHS